MSARNFYLLTLLFISFSAFPNNSVNSDLFDYLLQNNTSSFLISEKGKIVIEKEFEVQKTLNPKSLMFFNLLRHGFIEGRLSLIHI